MDSQIEFGNGDSQISNYDYTAPDFSLGSQFDMLNTGTQSSTQQSDIFKNKVNHSLFMKIMFINIYLIIYKLYYKIKSYSITVSIE